MSNNLRLKLKIFPKYVSALKLQQSIAAIMANSSFTPTSSVSSANSVIDVADYGQLTDNENPNIVKG